MRPQILLLFGGESSEHEVSIASAHNVYAALDEHKYEVSLCYITRDGKWLLVDSIDDVNSDRELMPVLGQKRLITTDGAEVTPDVIVPVLHGPFGEDGIVQGLGKLLHIPMMGPSLIGAAITMDKDVAKRLFREAGIPVVDWMVWDVSDPRPMYDNVVAKLGSPFFVKPTNAGSSVGVSKVSNESDYAAALDEAAKYDKLVTIERGVVNAREIEVGVLGNHRIEATDPGEVIAGKEFYDYEDKYDSSSAAQIIIPAELDAETAETIRHYAIKAYQLTRGWGMARVDFFIENGDVYLNEINSIPGFTNSSMYSRLWKNNGLSYPELLDRLITLARESN